MTCTDYVKGEHCVSCKYEVSTEATPLDWSETRKEKDGIKMRTGHADDQIASPLVAHIYSSG